MIVWQAAPTVPVLSRRTEEIFHTTCDGGCQGFRDIYFRNRKREDPLPGPGLGGLAGDKRTGQWSVIEGKSWECFSYALTISCQAREHSMTLQFLLLIASLRSIFSNRIQTVQNHIGTFSAAPAWGCCPVSSSILPSGWKQIPVLTSNKLFTSSLTCFCSSVRVFPGGGYSPFWCPDLIFAKMRKFKNWRSLLRRLGPWCTESLWSVSPSSWWGRTYIRENTVSNW